MCIKGIRSLFGIADPNQQQQQNAAAATQAATDQQNAEAAREGKIAQGKQSIDNAFAGYNDDYFNKYAKANVDAATPQIEDQYNTARDKLFASLTGRGVQNSTIAGGYYGALDKTRGTAEGEAANSAAEAANALRNSVQTQKNNLYSLNSTGADPSTIATQAIGASTALAPKPELYCARRSILERHQAAFGRRDRQQLFAFHPRLQLARYTDQRQRQGSHLICAILVNFSRARLALAPTILVRLTGSPLSPPRPPLLRPRQPPLLRPLRRLLRSLRSTMRDSPKGIPTTRGRRSTSNIRTRKTHCGRALSNAAWVDRALTSRTPTISTTPIKDNCPDWAHRLTLTRIQAPAGTRR
jgi:hypothetical protein